MEEKTDKFNFIKMQIFALWKNLSKGQKDRLHTGSKDVQNIYLTKDWYVE